MRSTPSIILALTSCLAVSSGPVMAIEIHGNARIDGGNTLVDSLETEVTQQRYLLNVTQPFGEWLRLDLFYRYTDYRTSTDTLSLQRTAKTPQAVLLYARPNFTARFDYSDRESRGTNPADNVDRTSAIGLFEWRPRRGPLYRFQFADESNVADPQLFGRDTESNRFDFDVVYSTEGLDARASYQISKIENNDSGFSLDQDKLQLRATYSNGFWNNRVNFSTDVWASRLNQTEEAPSGSMLAQPVPAVQGLFAINPTPEFGPLEPAPDLIDGNLETPVSPPINIGGANTFRNIGLDLAVTNRVTRLEITIDRPSDPSLIWEVFHGPDNFNWEMVLGVTSDLDQGLLRYTLTFPETTDRYFKVVNVSPNGIATVLVTEIRALLDVEQLGRDQDETSAYRINANVGFNATSRLRGSLALSASNDRDLAGGRLSQQVDQTTIEAVLQYDLLKDLQLNVGFLTSDFEQDLAPVLNREETRYTAGLGWTPYPTLVGTFDLLYRDESDLGNPIRTTKTARTRFNKQLYTTLQLISELNFSDVDDHAGGFSQEITRWSETLQSRPARNWRLGVGTILSWFDSVGIVTVSRRVDLQLFTQWQMFPALSLSANLSRRADDNQQTLNQRYSLFWSPGTKLSATLTYQDIDAENLRKIKTSGGTLDYRLNRWFRFFASLTRATTDNVGIGSTTTTSGRVGLNVNF